MMKIGKDLHIEKVSFRSQISRAFSVLPSKDKRYVTRLILAQSVLSFLDLVSILFIGVFVSTTLSDDNRGGVIEKVTQYSSNFAGSFSYGMGVLIVFAIMLLLLKTIASITLTRKTLKFFSSLAYQLSTRLVGHVFSNGIKGIYTRPLQELIFTTTRGVEILTLQIMATLAIMVSDLVLLLILTIGLFFIDIAMAIISLTLFGAVMLLLNLLMGKRSTKLGERNSLKTIASSQALEKLYYSFREMFVKNKVTSEVGGISSTRKELSETLTEINFFPYIGKYVIETSLVIGGAVIAIVVFTSKDLPSALTVMAMFLASGSRIAPSILRLQQSYITVRSYFGMTEPTLKLISEMQQSEESVNQDIALKVENSVSENAFIGNISIQQLNFKYSHKESFEIFVDALEIRAGSIVAIVGPSGAGKSTLTDLILGLLTPKSGSVSISGYEPSKAIAKWPGQIAYVPQEVRIFDGSLAENITQGYSSEEIMGFDLMDTMRDSALTELFRTSLDGFGVELGTKGARLSGGQIQRVGIARALLTKPKLIVFDEATSALDADTESIITETLAKLRGNTTVVIVAHRLSTVLNADSVIYLQEGQIVAEGSFGEVRAQVPDFDRQAQLMGLTSKNLS